MADLLMMKEEGTDEENKAMKKRRGKPTCSSALFPMSPREANTDAHGDDGTHDVDNNAAPSKPETRQGVRVAELRGSPDAEKCGKGQSKHEVED